LVELLVVILIIGILLAIALPTFLNQQDKANNTKALVALDTTYKVARSVATGQGGDMVTADHPLTDMKAQLHASEPELDFLLSSATIDTITPDVAGTTPNPPSPDPMITNTVYLTSDDTATTFNAAVLSASGDVCKLKVIKYSQLSYLGCKSAAEWAAEGSGGDTGGGDPGDGGDNPGNGDTGNDDSQTGDALDNLTPPNPDPLIDASQWAKLTSGSAWNGAAANSNVPPFNPAHTPAPTIYSGVGSFNATNAGWAGGGGDNWDKTSRGAYWQQGGDLSSTGSLGLATKVHFVCAAPSTDSYAAIWAAMPTPGGNSPSNSENGYQLAWIRNAASVGWLVVLSKWTGGTQSVLGEYNDNLSCAGSQDYALVVNPTDGTVSAWLKASGGGAWTKRIEADDTSYSHGFSAIEDSREGFLAGTLSLFAAGPLS